MNKKVVILAGGVGGAKMVDGFAQILPPGNLSVVVNTADDFEHYGLLISPDLDTVCYTLGNLSNNETGWGRAGESWKVLENLSILGGEDWFRLGDKDIATHLERTRRMRNGESLTEITKHFCKSWGIDTHVFPMCDQKVSTLVDTDEGQLSFQEYFVARKCQPSVNSFEFDGIASAIATLECIEKIESADLIIIAPSNPWVSIAPILKVGGIQNALSGKKVIAVSPIVGGKAIKGPAAKMYQDFGIEASPIAVATQYGEILTAFVFDEIDKHLEGDLSIPHFVTNTIMKTREDRVVLAREILRFTNI